MAERSCYVPQASDAALAPPLSSADATAAAPTASATPSVAPAPDEPVKCPVQVPSKLWEKLAAEFNPPQLRAISAACNTNTKSFRKSGEITLLQGPPGTGKTRTILGLLSAILHLSADRGGLISGAQKGSAGGNVRPAVRYSGNPRNSRILVCAPSNGAVDVIVHRLMTDGLVDADGKAFRPPIVRLGNTDALSAEVVQAATLDAQVNAKVSKSMELQAFKLAEEEAQKIRAQIRTLDGGGPLPGSETGVAKDEATPANRAAIRRQLKAQMGNASRRRVDALRALDNLRSRIRMEIIRDARIVLSTLSTSAANTLNDAVAAIGQGYGTVVVDEAGQAVEPATIIPLRYGCRNLILVGDPRQLPATVMSELVKSHGYDLSLFERLEKGGHPVRHPCSCLSLSFKRSLFRATHGCDRHVYTFCVGRCICSRCSTACTLRSGSSPPLASTVGSSGTPLTCVERPRRVAPMPPQSPCRITRSPASRHTWSTTYRVAEKTRPSGRSATQGRPASLVTSSVASSPTTRISRCTSASLSSRPTNPRSGRSNRSSTSTHPRGGRSSSRSALSTASRVSRTASFMSHIPS